MITDPSVKNALRIEARALVYRKLSGGVRVVKYRWISHVSRTEAELREFIGNIAKLEDLR